MHLSLFARMRELERIGVLSRERDPDIHYFPGEGRYSYKGKEIKYLVDFTGVSPDKSETFVEPTDIAWCPAEKVMLAYAPSNHEPFQPLKEPIHIRKT